MKEVWGRVIKQFEFDPESRPEVKPQGEGFKLVVDDAVVMEALKSPISTIG